MEMGTRMGMAPRAFAEPSTRPVTTGVPVTETPRGPWG